MGSVKVDNYAGLWIPEYDGGASVGFLGNIGDLTTYSGATTFTSGSTTIEDRKITDRLDVRDTASLTIRNCVFDLSNANSFVFTQWNDAQTATGQVLVEDTTFGVSGNDQGDHISTETTDTSLEDSGYGGIFRRCKFGFGRDGMQGGKNVLFEQCHVTDTMVIITPDYADCFQSQGGSHVTFSYCNMELVAPPEGNSCVILKTDLGDIDDFVFENSRFYGGAHIFDFDNDGGSGLVTNIHVRDCVIDGWATGVASNVDGIVEWVNVEQEDGTPVSEP